MAKLTRHLGRLSNSGSRCAVVFRKLEDDPTSCLICDTDALPDMVQDSIMSIITGVIGQNEVDLYKALTRSTLSDGSNALTFLHERGHMRKEPISNVDMVPFPNRNVPLKDINASIDGEELVETPAAVEPVKEVALDTGNVDENVAIAAGLITQADLMQQDADAKREQAYALDPSLKPTATKAKAKTTKKKVSDGRLKSDAEKAATLEARNKRRREAYAKKNADKIDAELNAQVAEKVARDAEALED